MVFTGSLIAETKMIECNSCSFNQIQGKIIASAGNKPITFHYVIDFDRDLLTRYKATIDQENGVYRVNQLTLPLDVKEAAEQYFLSKQSVKILFDENPTLLSDLISYGNTSSSIQSFSNDEFFIFTNGSQCPNSQTDKGVYDFLSTSSFRAQLFNDMKALYPTIQSLFNAWNGLAASANTTMGVLSVEGGWFAVPQKV